MRALAVLALAALILAAAPVARADVDLGAEVEKLRSEEHADRYGAYSALNRANDPAVIPLLVKVLPECPDLGQYYGCLVLQRFAKKSKAAFEKLRRAKSPHLRVLAAAALVRMGETKAAATIAEALEDPEISDTLRATMLLRIYSIRDPAVQAAVRRLLQPATSIDVLRNAIYNVYLVRDRAALEPLKGLDEHAQAGVQAMAGACRMVLGDLAGAATLTKAFEQGSIDTSSLYKVKSLLEQARPVPATVLAAVHAALEDETVAYALRTLIEILGGHGYAKAAKDIRALLEHDDGSVSKAAFEALATLPGGLDTDTMRKLLQGGEDARRLAAADALRKADDPSGFDVVVEILRRGKNTLDRSDAARALAGFRRAEAIEPLLEALDDPQSSVRSNAYSSVGQILYALFPYRRFNMGSLGYVATGPAAQRKQAAAKLRAWWAKHKDAAW